MTASTLVNRNVIMMDRRTSVRLEPEFWRALEEIAQHEGRPVREIVWRAESPHRGLTAAVRVYVLEWFAARSRAAQPADPGRQA